MAEAPGASQGMAEAPPHDGRWTGVVEKRQGNFGFINVDDGPSQLFVLPRSCEKCGLGGIPAVGTKVTFDMIPDERGGKKRADNVELLDPSQACLATIKDGETQAGVMSHDNGRFGFIQLPDGRDIFVLPTACKKWFKGQLPPIGLEVVFEVVPDPESGRPRAENVAPLHPESPEAVAAAAGQKQKPLVEGVQFGVMKRENKGKFGFIECSDGSDLFVSSNACTGFGYQFPPIGTEVQFEVMMDMKAGKPRAENVQPRNNMAGWMGGSVPPMGNVPGNMILPPGMPGVMVLPQPVPAMVRPPVSGPQAELLRDVTGMLRQQGMQCGLIDAHNGSFAFMTIADGSDMLVLPAACTGFDGVIPAVGTEVVFEVGKDPGTGWNKAVNIQALASLLPHSLGVTAAFAKDVRTTQATPGGMQMSAMMSVMVEKMRGLGGGYGGGCAGGDARAQVDAATAASFGY